MATDFSKNAQNEFQNLANTLSKIQSDYQKSIDAAAKQTLKLSGGWKTIGKEIVDSLKGVKSIESLEKKIQAGKTASKALDDVVKSGLQSRKKISTDLQNINEEMYTLSAGMGKSALPAMTDAEKERWNYLNYQKSSLEKQAVLQGKQIRDTIVQRTTQENITKSQEKELEKRNKNLASINAALNVLNLTKETILFLINLAERYDKVLQKIANDVGIGRIEAEKFVPALSAAASKSIALGATLADAGLAAKELVDQFELVANMALEDVNHQMLVLNKAFGIALSDSAKFYGSLTQIGNASLESQTNMTAVADAAAKAAGVPLGRVIKDVASISNGVRLLFKGNTAELIKQVAEARKLGTTLDSAGKSAESLLDFESSVASELKASALLGKNVNFNESRRLFFSGKILEGEKALIRELENIGDLNELNYFQRKAIAQLTGKDFSELQKIQAQKKQQLDIDSRFPQLAKERREEEEKLSKIMGSTEAQRERALEMEARDNIANARANVLAAQKEQILVNISRILQPLYRVLTQMAEWILKGGIWLTELVANWSKTEPLWTSIGVAVLGIGTAFGAVRLAMSLWSAGLSPLGLSISRFLITVGSGLASLAASGSLAIPIILSIAAALAAVGVAGWGLGKLFSGIGDLIRSILDPIVKLIEAVITGFNTFVSNIGTAITNVASGLKSITDIGFTGLAKSAAGVSLMANSIASLGLALALFPTDKLTGFATNFAAIANTNVASINKLSELFESATSTGGKLMIGIEDEAVASINKLADLKGEREELKQTIREGNDRLVKSIETLTSMMANGGIAVNLDGQRLNAGLSKTTYRSGGFGQATSLA